MRTDTKLEREVAAICDLPREELVALWVKTYGCPPPKGVKRGLLERSAAWHLQAKRLGGLSAQAKRAIRAYAKQRHAERQLADEPATTDAFERDKSANAFDGVAVFPAVRPHASAEHATPPAGSNKSNKSSRSVTAPIIKPPPVPGTRLMREWNGRMHVVDITGDGILFDGKLYRSLTAVAKRITGTHWSGPRFFGL
ncbi:MAG: DUF2924 domain-containing protein [Rhizobiaceae bacterium]|nr:DUF2924 domain-containing protein [Rhizobiaceae bacterium]